MTVAIQAALVRIWDNENQIAGAGFLVTENHVLTCAHVVSDALGRPRQEMPAAPVLLDFPFVEPGKKVTAVVTLWQPKRPDGTGDIAGLELQASLPDGARPLRLVNTPDTWNHPFRAFGFPIFPSRHDEGVWASGVLRDRTVNGHIHIEDTKTTGYSMQPGFSGTAVWDETLHGVIGMVATAEIRAETKAAFIIPTDKLIETWSLLKEQRAVPHQQSVAVPAVEAPLLIGILVDVSGSIVTALRKNSPVAKTDLGEVFDLLVRKIVEVCQTDNSAEALPKIALFAYGFGFGQLNKGVDDLLQKIGLIATSKPIIERSSEAVRDLFAGAARKYRLPTTPDASLLQKYSEQFKQGLKEQLVDTELGPSLLYAGLCRVYLRLRQEMEKPYYQYPLLIVVTDGQFEGASDDDVVEICQQIAGLGVSIAFCYIGMRDVTSPRTLYGTISPEWPPETYLLYKLSSPLTGENVLLRGLANEAKTRGWHIPENARLFLQVNHSEEIAEFVELLLSKLHG